MPCFVTLCDCDGAVEARGSDAGASFFVVGEGWVTGLLVVWLGGVGVGQSPAYKVFFRVVSDSHTRDALRRWILFFTRMAGVVGQT